MSAPHYPEPQVCRLSMSRVKKINRRIADCPEDPRHGLTSPTPRDHACFASIALGSSPGSRPLSLFVSEPCEEYL